MEARQDHRRDRTGDEDALVCKVDMLRRRDGPIRGRRRTHRRRLATMCRLRIDLHGE
jgi:hypothetical protein